MAAGQSRAASDSLRHVLKARTQDLHDELDVSLSGAVLDPRGYIHFLAVQYAVRAPIERWALANMATDIAPPAVAHLIAADLFELGAGLPRESEFDFPPGADPIGVAWTLGGSSLGNRFLFARRRKAGLDTACRFLSDSSGEAYFRKLLPRLAVPVSSRVADAAIAGAGAVFHAFLAAVRDRREKAAA